MLSDREPFATAQPAWRQEKKSVTTQSAQVSQADTSLDRRTQPDNCLSSQFMSSQQTPRQEDSRPTVTWACDPVLLDEQGHQGRQATAKPITQALLL